MNKGRAMFQYHRDGYYIPANSAANSVTSIISNRFPRPIDMIKIRQLGYIPCLTDGQEIGGIDVKA